MQAYRVVSIEKTQDIPHAEAGEGKWYCYIITNGINSISGYRNGKLRDVRDYLSDVVQRMNREYHVKLSGSKRRSATAKPCFTPDSYLAGYS